ncbi:MAG TPA: hypothetical protein VLD67_13755 [Vicinamibacterales bacterium]|nr:hypothetical protein [Vicinamibacterales bacterium]
MFARPALVASVIVASLTAVPWDRQGTDPRSLGPFDSVLTLDDGEWRDLRAGRTIVRSLPPAHDDHVALFLAGRITITPERFIERLRRSAELWKSEQVPRSGTFTAPVDPGNVASMILPATDVRGARDCQPGSCSVKLGAPEMERVRRAIERNSGSWEEAVQREFRQIALDRVAAFRREGLRGLPAPHDHSIAADLQTVLSQLMLATPLLSRHARTVADYLERYPRAALPPGADEVTYWLETSETPKPTIQALHAVAERRRGRDQVEVMVVTLQIFATHYVNGSLSVSALLRDASDPSRQYLVYVNNTATDGLGGFFSGIKRFFVERRIRAAAKRAFEHFVRRIQE